MASMAVIWWLGHVDRLVHIVTHTTLVIRCHNGHVYGLVYMRHLSAMALVTVLAVGGDVQCRCDHIELFALAHTIEFIVLTITVR